MIFWIAALLILSFVLTLGLTPRVAAVAERFDLMDRPSARKVHSIAIPRIGGVAIFIAFNLALLAGLLIPPIKAEFFRDPRLIYLITGGVFAFLLGFYDDVRKLNPYVKFLAQIFTALIPFLGGITISRVFVPVFGQVNLGAMALPVTIFWIVLIINAINLIDGLDGLAAGVCFFVCAVLISISIVHDNSFIVTIMLACLAGALMGFLIFNFNPASIFMGDSGSYFLGYMLATLSMSGSLKTHTAYTFLIPFIVLGVPILDTAWATLRRFLLGRGLFQADSDHFHHRLLKLGFSHRRAVLLLYGATIFLAA